MSYTLTEHNLHALETSSLLRYDLTLFDKPVPVFWCFVLLVGSRAVAVHVLLIREGCAPL